MPASPEQSAAPFVPDRRMLPVLQKALQHCRGRDHDQNATQAVFWRTGDRSQGKKAEGCPAREIDACRPWLSAELEAVRLEVIRKRSDRCNLILFCRLKRAGRVSHSS